MKRRILASLLSLVMALSLLPATALAEDETMPVSEEPEAVVEPVEEPAEEPTEEPEEVAEPTETETVQVQAATAPETVELAENEETEPIAISNADQIYALARILDSKAEDGDYKRLGVKEGTNLQSAAYQLENNIKLTNHENGAFNGFYGIPDFQGTFDGRGHTITLDIDFSAYADTGNCGGVFKVLNGATVKNIELDGKAEGTLTLSASLNNVGLLAGFVNGSETTIEDITTSVEVDFTMVNGGRVAYFGAVLGRNNLSSAQKLAVTNCVNNGAITAKVEGELSNPSRVAGLIGHSNAGAVMDNCRNDGAITVTGATTFAGGLTGTFNDAIYKNCVEAASVSSPKSAARLFDSMKNTTVKADGNVIEVTIKGTDGQTITAADGVSEVVTGGEAVLRLPVYFVDSNTRRYEKYNADEALQVDGKSLYLFDVTSKNATLTLNTADATDERLPFSSWETAIHLSAAADLIDLQNAVNNGDSTAITALYAKKGVKVPGDLAAAQIVLRSAYYVLDENVTLSKNFTGIGTGVSSFGGHFDGQGHTVTLTISATASDTENTNYYGLFGYMLPLTDGVVELKNLKVEAAIDLTLPTTMKYGVYAGGVAGYINRLTVDNVSVNTTKIAAASEGTPSGGDTFLGGAFGFESILIGGAVDTTVSGPITANWSGNARLARLGGFAGQGRVGGSVTFKDGASIQANTVSGSVGGIMGYSWSQNDFTGLTVKNMSETPVLLGGKNSGNEIRTGLLIGDHTTRGIQTNEVGVKIDGFKPEGKFDLNGFSVGGLIGLLQTNGIVEITNSAANVGNVTYEKQMGGLIGTCWTSQTVYQISDTVYVKATDDLKTLGSPSTILDGAIALDVTKVDGGSFGDAEENVLSGTAPAALTVSDNAKLDGTSLIYTKADENPQDIIFYWNGTELYRKSVTVNKKDMTNETIELVGVSSSYASNDAAQADLDDVRVIYGDKELVKGTDYDIEANNGQFTITFKGNYAGTQNKPYAIDPDFVATAADYTGVYDGKPHGIKVTASDGAEIAYSESADGTFTGAVELIDAGTKTVYWKAAKDGKEITGSAVITIKKAPLTIKADDMSMTVGGTLPKFTYTSTGLVNGDSLTIEPKLACLADGSVAGTYSIVPSGADAGSNYEITYVNGTLTIYSRSSGGSGSSSSGNSYTVSVPSTKNGDVTVSPKNAKKGDTVTVTVTPDKGYELDSLTVKDANGNTVKLTDKGNGKYTFTMPSSKVTVSAEFVEEQAASTFADVPADAYYAKAVEWAVKNGITNGKSSGLFGSNDPCTRGQIVTFLWRTAGSPAPKGTAAVPADVLPGSYCYDAVAWALENGITNGFSDGTFGVNNTCTRGQSVTLLFRNAVANGLEVVTLQDLISGFGDAAELPAYAVPAMNWALSSGIVQGNGGLLLSNASCTRAQIVTFLYRAYQGK